MTGFGRAEISLPGSGCAVVEIHTLNHRFLEVECRLPEGFQEFEEAIRTVIARSIRRGRVKVSVALKAVPSRASLLIHTNVARQYVAQLRRLQRQLGLSGPVTLEMVLGLPHVVATAGQELFPQRTWPFLKKGASEALAQVGAMRSREGKRLGREMVRITESLERLSRKVRQRVPLVEEELRKKFRGRLDRVVGQRGDNRGVAKVVGNVHRGRPDAASVAAEAASFVQSTDVSEEIVRIHAHLATLHQALHGNGESPGRMVDFLAQELHREVNTLGSKMRDGKIVGWVVAMKGLIEKLREQAANVE